MSQVNSPNSRNRSGSVTPRRRGDEHAQSDELAMLAATAPILLQLPDLHPNQLGEPGENSGAGEAVVETGQDNVPDTPPEVDRPVDATWETLAIAEQTIIAHTNTEQPVSEQPVSEQPVSEPRDAESASEEPVVSASQSTIAGSTSVDDSNHAETPEKLTIPVSELAASMAARDAAVAPPQTRVEEPTNSDVENSEATTANEDEELPWENQSEVVVGSWTEMGGRIFVGLLSTLLVVTLTWSIWQGDDTESGIEDPVVDDKIGVNAAETDVSDGESRIGTSLAMDPVDDDSSGNSSNQDVVPGGLRLSPTNSGVDPYVTTASGEMPAEPLDDGQFDTFTIRTLRPSADPNSTPNTANPNTRVGQPTEQFNDSIYR